MRKIILIIAAVFIPILSFYGQEATFGKITITPYVTIDAGIDATARKLLCDKMTQIVTRNEASGGFDRRFVITPSINVLSEAETNSIPQKTSLKVSITFYIGDGVSGSLFNSCNMELTGVGDNHQAALYSAIRKIRSRDTNLQALVNEGKQRIVIYYNTIAPNLIKEAEGYIAALNYEKALAQLAVIPSICNDYNKAQSLIVKCGNKIIERDNNTMLTKAKAVWSAHPDEYGAQQASVFLSKVVISSAYFKSEVERLNQQIQQRLTQLEDKRLELEKVKILSEERLQTERINASARVTSTFISTLPNLVYNILRWF